MKFCHETVRLFCGNIQRNAGFSATPRGGILISSGIIHYHIFFFTNDSSVDRIGTDRLYFAADWELLSRYFLINPVYRIGMDFAKRIVSAENGRKKKGQKNEQRYNEICDGRRHGRSCRMRRT